MESRTSCSRTHCSRQPRAYSGGIRAEVQSNTSRRFIRRSPINSSGWLGISSPNRRSPSPLRPSAGTGSLSILSSARSWREVGRPDRRSATWYRRQYGSARERRHLTIRHGQDDKQSNIRQSLPPQPQHVPTGAVQQGVATMWLRPECCRDRSGRDRTWISDSLSLGNPDFTPWARPRRPHVPGSGSERQWSLRKGAATKLSNSTSSVSGRRIRRNSELLGSLFHQQVLVEK